MNKSELSRYWRLMNVVVIVNSLSISEERLVVVTWCILKNI